LIIYFSGTGNSKLVAEKLSVLMKERVHNIEDGAPPIIYEQEILILVAPLYFWTLPSIVLSYLAEHEYLNIKELHVLMTCGGALGAGATLITKQLSGLGYDKAYIHALVMTTNYIPLHNVQSPDMAAKAIQTALNKLPDIAEDIRQKRSAKTSPILGMGLSIARRMYDKARHTQHFYTTNLCIGCGLCERSCPSHAIRLIENRPKWIKAKCTLCLRCLHHCPVVAIEYGKSTVGKDRYHPEKFFSKNN